MCSHGKKQTRRVRLKYCDPGAEESLRMFKYVEATTCVCRTCHSTETSCEGLPFYASRSLWMKLYFLLHWNLIQRKEEYIELNEIKKEGKEKEEKCSFHYFPFITILKYTLLKVIPWFRRDQFDQSEQQGMKIQKKGRRKESNKEWRFKRRVEERRTTRNEDSKEG